MQNQAACSQSASVFAPCVQISMEASPQDGSAAQQQLAPVCSRPVPVLPACACSLSQVLCSRDAWLAAAPSLDAAASVDNGQPLVSGISMGPRVLKGIADPVELFMVTLQDRTGPVTVNGIIMEDMDGSVGEALGYESGGRVTGVQGGVRQSPQGGNSGKIRRASLVLNVGGSASASVGAGPSSAVA